MEKKPSYFLIVVRNKESWWWPNNWHILQPTTISKCNEQHVYLTNCLSWCHQGNATHITSHNLINQVKITHCIVGTTETEEISAAGCYSSWRQCGNWCHFYIYRNAQWSVKSKISEQHTTTTCWLNQKNNKKNRMTIVKILGSANKSEEIETDRCFLLLQYPLSIPHPPYF